MKYAGSRVWIKQEGPGGLILPAGWLDRLPAVVLSWDPQTNTGLAAYIEPPTAPAEHAAPPEQRITRSLGSLVGIHPDILTEPPPPYWACDDCGCTEIQWTAWVEANTDNNTGDEGPLDRGWCPGCESESRGDCDAQEWVTAEQAQQLLAARDNTEKAD